MNMICVDFYIVINNSVSHKLRFTRLQYVISSIQPSFKIAHFYCFLERTETRRGGRARGDVRRENEKNTHLANGPSERRDRDNNAPRERRGGGFSGGFNRRKEGSQGEDSPEKEGGERERGGRGMRGFGGRGGRGQLGQRGGGSFGRKREFERRSGSDRS